MKLIAIETSGRLGSLAALELVEGQPTVCGQQDLPPGQRSAQSIGPCLKLLLEEAAWPAEALDAVAVASGPGSFTGLRVGVTAAKMLALVAQCPVVEVGVLDVLAAQAGEAPVWAVLDAQRGELFAARYETTCATPELGLMPIEDFVIQVMAGERVTGPIASKLSLPEGVTAIVDHRATPHAETVARLAAQRYDQGHTISAEQLTPRYHRLSAAEEKRLREPG